MVQMLVELPYGSISYRVALWEYQQNITAQETQEDVNTKIMGKGSHTFYSKGCYQKSKSDLWGSYYGPSTHEDAVSKIHSELHQHSRQKPRTRLMMVKET